MEKILLVMDDKRNQRFLEELLNDKYEVVLSGDSSLVTAKYDLTILDITTLQRNINTILLAKEENYPIFLPYLLIFQEKTLSKLDTIFLQTVDEFIKVPAENIEIYVRIESLLNLRKTSLESEQRYHALVENSPVGICILRNMKICYANPALTAMLSSTENKLLETFFLDYIHNEDYSIIKECFDSSIMGKSVLPIEVRNITTNLLGWLQLHLSKIKYKEQEAVLVIALDITEQKVAHEQVNYLSFRDQLTGLYNRAYFQEEFKRLDTERQLPLSIILGDLNGLKMINDAFGHMEGDKLIKGAAEAINGACRQEDIVARWGGDEYGVLLPKTGNDIAEKICQRIQNSCDSSENDIKISIALGTATKTDIFQNLDAVMKKAEDNMYHQKLKESARIKGSMISSLEKILHEKDIESKEHLRRMKLLAMDFGRQLNLSQSQQEELTLLTRLHDIGKVTIPVKILLKPGKLTEYEWEIVKKHPETGYRISQAVPELARVADAILSHHENWDGKGYPHHLEKKQIPYLARILIIIDAFDVMTSNNIYKKIVSKKEALQEIKRSAGTQFDPELAETFIRLINSKC